MLVLSVFVINTEVKALTDSDVEALIKALNLNESQVQIIKSLVKPKTTQKLPVCETINSNLKFGDSGEEVAKLVRKLNKIGLLSGKTDNFDEEVASAVVQFQDRYASEILYPNNLKRGTGYVGPATRKVLNRLYCEDVSVPVPSFPIPMSTPIPVLPIQDYETNVENIIGKVKLISADEDKAPKHDQNGRISAPDWKWEVSLKNKSEKDRVIKKMVLVHNTFGEGWATDENANNPVGKYLYTLAYTKSKCDNCWVSDSQVNNINFKLPSGSEKEFYLYGYPGSHSFTGGTLVIEFNDGGVIKIPIQASSITPSLKDKSTITPSISITNDLNNKTLRTGERITVNWTTENIGSGTYLDIMRLRRFDEGVNSGNYQTEYPIVTNFINDGSETITIPEVPAGTYAFEIKSTVKGYSGAIKGFSNKFDITTNGDDPIESVIYPPKIADIIGISSVYSPGDTINFSIKGIDYNGTPASQDKGYNVQVYIFPENDTSGNYLPPNPSNSYNGTYDTSSRHWKVKMVAPSVSGGYKIKIALYCSRTNSQCWNISGKGWGDTVKFVPFNVSNDNSSVSVTTINASAKLANASSDKVSTTFGSGSGSGIVYPKTAYDWRWDLTLNAQNSSSADFSKKIKSITVYHNTYGEGWSTSASSDNELGKTLYPLYIIGNGYENTRYDENLYQELSLNNSEIKLELFGQIESPRFAGGKVVIKFTDGTSVTAQIPSSNITPTASTATSSVSTSGLSSSAFDALVELLDIRGSR